MAVTHRVEVMSVDAERRTAYIAVASALLYEPTGWGSWGNHEVSCDWLVARGIDLVAGATWTGILP